MQLEDGLCDFAHRAFTKQSGQMSNMINLLHTALGLTGELYSTYTTAAPAHKVDSGSFQCQHDNVCFQNQVLRLMKVKTNIRMSWVGNWPWRD